MLINKKDGSISSVAIGNRIVDKLLIEWYEANKRILHKQTQSGRQVALKFLQEKPDLKDGDILWQDENVVIAVEIQPCEVIVVKPETIFEASCACYEIGNKHLPLFYEGDELLIPYEEPLNIQLEAAGFKVKVEKRKLTNALRTTVLPHIEINKTNLFSKIFNTTSSL